MVDNAWYQQDGRRFNRFDDTTAVEQQIYRAAVLVDANAQPERLAEVFLADATVQEHGVNNPLPWRVWAGQHENARFSLAPPAITFSTDGSIATARSYFDATLRRSGVASNLRGMFEDKLVREPGSMVWKIRQRKSVKPLSFLFASNSPRRAFPHSVARGNMRAQSAAFGTATGQADSQAVASDVTEIKQLLCIYSHLLDRFELDRLCDEHDGIFHPTSTMIVGKEHAVGLADVKRWFQGYKQRFSSNGPKTNLRHKVSTPLVRVLPNPNANACYAEAVSYYDAELTDVETGATSLTVGRYEDTLVRDAAGTGGRARWRVLHRTTNTLDEYAFERPASRASERAQGNNDGSASERGGAHHYRLVGEWNETRYARIMLPSVSAVMQSPAADVVAIQQLIARRCYLTDGFGQTLKRRLQMKRQLYSSGSGVFTQEVRITIVDPDGSTQSSTLQPALDLVPSERKMRDVAEQVQGGRHKLTTPIVCVTGTTAAVAVAYFDYDAQRAAEQDEREGQDDHHGAPFRMNGRYEFECQKVGGRWYVAHMVAFVSPVQFDFGGVAAAPVPPAGAPPAAGSHSRI